MPTFTGEVHPVAELFPMLADTDLADLAEDIATRGLLQPIVLDPEGRLLDGRNRLAACQKAGIEPIFVNYDGDDPAGYALTVNITRRHLSTGARAILAEQARRLNGVSKSGKFSEESGVRISRLSDAATVIDWEPALVPAVITGAEPLSRAVEKARAAKRDAEALQAKLDRLRNNAEDLAALVDEGRMGIDDAIAALDARQTAAENEQRERDTERRQAITRAQGRLQSLIDGWIQLCSLPGHDDRDDILESLTPHDRQTVLEIEAIYLKGTGQP